MELQHDIILSFDEDKAEQAVKLTESRSLPLRLSSLTKTILSHSLPARNLLSCTIPALSFHTSTLPSTNFLPNLTQLHRGTGPLPNLYYLLMFQPGCWKSRYRYLLQ